VASVFGFVLYKRRRDALEEKRDAESRALVSDTELRALRAQMNPHFIFNSLNSIGDYMLKKDTDTALDYLGKFAQLMRQVLEHSEHREIPLAEDLAFVELYLQVELRRQPGGFTHKIQVGEDLDPENVLVPPLILQPFLENSIWHGFADRTGPGHILVDIQREGDGLRCRVEDNGSGPGRVGQGDAGKRSFGLSITQSRLELLNREKGTGAYIWVGERENGGTRVEIKLPLMTQF
jgi:LytS/YehU family sensor histidine kinase